MDDIDRGQEREQIDRDLALKAALARSAPEGGNGKCEECGEAIDARRLQVKPGAARCIDCQVIWEQTCKNRASIP